MRPAAVLERAIQQLLPRAQPGELALPDGPQHSGGATTTALYIGAEALAGPGQEAALETAPGQVDQNREAIAAHRQVAIERARYGGALGLVAAVQPRGTLPAPTYLSLNGSRTRYNAVREPVSLTSEAADELPTVPADPAADKTRGTIARPASLEERVRWQHARVPDALPVRSGQSPGTLVPVEAIVVSYEEQTTIAWLNDHFASRAWQEQTTNSVVLAGPHGPDRVPPKREIAETAAAPSGATVLAHPPAAPVDIPCSLEMLARQFFTNQPGRDDADLVIGALDWSNSLPGEAPVRVQHTGIPAPTQGVPPRVASPRSTVAEDSGHIWQIHKLHGGKEIWRLNRDWAPERRIPLVGPVTSDVPLTPLAKQQVTPAGHPSSEWRPRTVGPAARTSAIPVQNRDPNLLKLAALSPEQLRGITAAASTALKAPAPRRYRQAPPTGQHAPVRQRPAQPRRQALPPQPRQSLWAKAVSWLRG